MQIAHLLFSDVVQPDYQKIRDRIGQLLGEAVESSPPNEVDKAFVVFYPKHKVCYKDGEMPAQTAFLVASPSKEGDGWIRQVEQSWGFPGAKSAVERSSYTLAVMELMARHLEPEIRLRLFHTALQASLEVVKPNAIVFSHSCQVVEPDNYLACSSKSPELRPGAINVRFFRVMGKADEFVMDTRGLEELGLPDLQCHFQSLDPNEIARVLFNTAIYIVEKGPVIESGQTVAGRSPHEKWLCQYEESILEPKRTVLDINPGKPFAAGNR